MELDTTELAIIHSALEDCLNSDDWNAKGLQIYWSLMDKIELQLKNHNSAQCKVLNLHNVKSSICKINNIYVNIMRH